MYGVGQILFLERSIAGLPSPSGYWVLCELTPARASIALVSQDEKGLYAIDNRYEVSVEDLLAFTVTGKQARVSKEG